MPLYSKACFAFGTLQQFMTQAWQMQMSCFMHNFDSPHNIRFITFVTEAMDHATREYTAGCNP
jgi:hypothetical protein